MKITRILTLISTCFLFVSAANGADLKVDMAKVKSCNGDAIISIKGLGKTYIDVAYSTEGTTAKARLQKPTDKQKAKMARLKKPKMSVTRTTKLDFEATKGKKRCSISILPENESDHPTLTTTLLTYMFGVQTLADKSKEVMDENGVEPLEDNGQSVGIADMISGVSTMWAVVFGSDNQSEEDPVNENGWTQAELAAFDTNGDGDISAFEQGEGWDAAWGQDHASTSESFVGSLKAYFYLVVGY